MAAKSSMNLTLQLLHRLDHRIKRIADENLARHGLTFEGSKLLHILCRAGEVGLSQKALGEEFDIRGSSVTSLLQKLEKRELIERRGGSDGRVKNVFITEKGRALDGELGDFIVSLHDVVLGNISEQQQESMQQLLKAALGNLDVYSGCTGRGEETQTNENTNMRKD